MNEQRLAIAKEMGADSTVLIAKGETPEQIAKRVVETIGVAPHATIDCAGFESTITVGILV
jgi:threonine dehydrogenase-like Zn-dependent dehydrogenase